MKQSLLFLAVSPLLSAEPLKVHEGMPPIAPPTSPPIVRVERDSRATEGRVSAKANLYSIGDPTPEEQLYLEFINRARANPAAEGILLATTPDSIIQADIRATQVDVNLLKSQFAPLQPVQPLAFNSKLIAAARLHSEDMLANAYQDHTNKVGATTGDRVSAQGYFGSLGENVYSYAKSVAHGHAAFEVDWGGPPENGGMQLPSGHRIAIHNTLYREVGVGVALGSNQKNGEIPVGPQVVTQDFGVQQNSTPFITGVAYYDLNGNNFYDIGEGIGNLNVTVSGSSYEGITSRSGGYAVPVPRNGAYTVTFSGSGFEPVTKSASVVGSKNLKVDFTPSYSAPSISGAVVATANRPNSYSISPVPGASEYQWRSYQKLGAALEGAENDSVRLTITQTGSYDVIQGIIVKSGSFAFHLITPSESARSQYITLSPTYFPNANASLTFQSQLGFGLPDQHARVQISADAGSTWETVYNQDGDIDNPETTWRQRTVSLAAYVGKAIRIRFAYEFLNGSFVSSSDLNVGWLLDDIQFVNTQEIVNEKIGAVSGTTIQFTPETVGDFCLQARAKTGHVFLDWGPSVAVRSTPATGAPEFRLSTSMAASQLQLDADLASGVAPAKLTLQSKTSLGGTWQDLAVPPQTVSATSYRFSLAPPSASGAIFYRLRAE